MAEHDTSDGPAAGDADAVSAEDAEDRRLLGGMTDAVRKALSSGVRSVMNSEIKGIVTDTLPKELVHYMKRSTDAAKDEVVRIIGSQTKRFLDGIDVSNEVQKILTSLSFEIRTEVRFIPNDQKVKPDVKVRARTKRTGERKKPWTTWKSSSPEQTDEEAADPRTEGAEGRDL